MCNSETQKSSPPNPITTGRQLRLSSIPKTRTVMMDESCAVRYTSQSPSESTALHKMVEMLVALFSITTLKFPSSPGMTELHLQ